MKLRYIKYFANYILKINIAQTISRYNASKRCTLYVSKYDFHIVKR